MKKLTIILFFLGIFLEMCSFCFSQVEHISLVSEIVSPAYAKGMQGIKRLEANETLLPKDMGFPAISAVIMSSLQELNPPERLSRITVQKIVSVPRGTDIKIGGKSIFGGISNVRVTFSNKQELSFMIDGLRTKLVNAHFNTLFIVACGIFVIGVLLQLCGFWLHVVKGKK